MQFEQCLTAGPDSCVRLDISDLNIETTDTELKRLLDETKDLFIFKTSTYVKLKPGRQDDGWNAVFGAINVFMNTLDTNEKIELATCIGYMHDKIITWFKIHDQDMQELEPFIRELGAMLDLLDINIDLCTKLREFVVGHMPIGLFADAGKRAQDSEDLTFHPDEVIDLMTITLLCKMFSPIFSTLMRSLNKRIDTKMKEIQCASIFSMLFSRRYKPLIVKLEHYIEHTVKQVTETSLSSLMHGYNDYSLTLHLKSQLLIRQFVNVDLSIKNGNLMTYIIVSAKRAIRTAFSSINKTPTYSRKPIMSKHEDDGNTAQIEIDSMTSKKLSDTKELISVAVDDTMKYLHIYDINPDSYEEVLSYYRKNPIVPTPINQMLCNMFYADDLGGGRGISYLKAPDYTRLVALLQMILFQLDVNYQSLAHAMTMHQSSDQGMSTMINDGQFRLSIGATDAYRKCKMRLEASPFGANGKDWDNHIQELTEHLLMTGYTYNTAPWLWNWLDKDNLNGKLIEPEEITIVAICSFYDWIQEMKQLAKSAMSSTALVY
jgi:hypothetical protein